MGSWKIIILAILICSTVFAVETRLPFSTVFKGQNQFDRLVVAAKRENWKSLPIGERTAAVGQALTGTRYKHFTLEIDNRIEAPSVNFQGMDCWTFFEISLAFARMLNEPEENWTPERLLHYIEMDRYRGGTCTGEYLSRLHYLEDWLYDNDQRGLVSDITRDLGGKSVPHSARECRRGRFTRFQKIESPASNQNCAAATSSGLFREIAAVSIPRRTLDSRFAPAMGLCIFYTHRRQTITVAS